MIRTIYWDYTNYMKSRCGRTDCKEKCRSFSSSLTSFSWCKWTSLSFPTCKFVHLHFLPQYVRQMGNRRESQEWPSNGHFPPSSPIVRSAERVYLCPVPGLDVSAQWYRASVRWTLGNVFITDAKLFLGGLIIIIIAIWTRSKKGRCRGVRRVHFRGAEGVPAY